MRVAYRETEGRNAGKICILNVTSDIIFDDGYICFETADSDYAIEVNSIVQITK